MLIVQIGQHFMTTAKKGVGVLTADVFPVKLGIEI